MSVSVSGCLNGGLGNQLFILAAVFGYARRLGIEPSIQLNYLQHSPHSHQMYEWTIFKLFQKTRGAPTHVHQEAKDRCLCYDQIGGASGFNTPHLLLYGYFQHERYMEGHAREFLELLRFPDVTLDGWYENACFFHVRRGDYLQQNLHCVDLWTRYYPAALAKMQSLHPGVNVLVCSDDIEWCEGHPMFKDETTFRFLKEKNEVKTMEIMSRCRVGGICANSSFSWWSAYKNDNPDKIVFFPSQWFNADWSNNVAFHGSHVLEV
jgi:hypothetical protein